MFENILGQVEASERLERDLSQARLPPAMLFEGPALSAKASAALELGRALSCARGARWNCECEHCSRHRILAHPDALILGPKELRRELAAGAELLKRAPGLPSRFFFVRAVRKLTRRFDQALYAGEEGKLTKALPLLRAALEASDACLPGGLGDEEAAKEAEKLLSSAYKLHELLPDATPVFQVRAVERWARQTPLGDSKLVIIEHADRMLDASRNALLKILEEPPAFARFILTSSRKQALIPTILSRVRPYRFVRRPPAAQGLILERIFKLRPEDASEAAARPASLEAYFSRYQAEGSGGRVAGLGRAFAAALAEGTAGASSVGGPAPAAPGAAGAPSPLAALAAGSKAASPYETIAAAAAASANFGASDEAWAWSFPSFLEETVAAFASLCRAPNAGEAELRSGELAAALARDALMRYSSYNLAPVALAERFAADFLRMARDGSSVGRSP